MKKNLFFVLSIFMIVACGQTKDVNFKEKSKQNTYWQQHVDYTMDIDMDVKNYKYKGNQKLIYTNNSPDDLNKVFYHLYFNAFQPGSQMDVRSLNIKDPSKKIGARISKLKPNEIGYIKVNSLKQNGVAVSHETVGTILEVQLNQPIKAGESVTLEMTFDAQVPVQIRRSGRRSCFVYVSMVSKIGRIRF